MEVLPTANIKNSKHVNLVFEAPGWDRKLAAAFLDWLGSRSTTPIATAVKDAHLDELERRLAGKSLVSVSRKSGVSLRDLRFMPVVLQYFAYARIRRPGLDLSFDVFNAGNELALGEEPAGLALEIFAIDGRTIAPLVEVVLEAIRDWPVAYAFGGANTFTAGFVLAHLRAKEGGRVLHVRDCLWPFTFSNNLKGLDEGTVQRLPAFRVGREAGGHWVWLFEDLYMGQDDDYSAAAKALGLRSLWEHEFLHGADGR